MFHVLIDAEHDRSSAYAFGLSPRGHRLDIEIRNDGRDNEDAWTGLWEGATHQTDTGWTAEFEIPWATVGWRVRSGEQTIGLNFRRWDHAWVAFWALPSPGTIRSSNPSKYGTLTGLEGVSPSELITLVPYVAVAYSPEAPDYRREVDPGFLRDFDKGRSPLATYGGLYGRIQPGLGIRADFVVNPDYSQVSPDAAVAQLDRFELFFPELRQFFVQTGPSYRFGIDGYDLFYTRRLGLRLRRGVSDEVPLYYAANALFRRRGTLLTVMDVMNAPLPGPIERGLDTSVATSHATIARFKQSFGSNQFGLIGMNKTEPWAPSAYRAYGADGVLTMLDRHVTLTGFIAGSDKQVVDYGQAGPAVRGVERYRTIYGFTGYGSATFRSEDITASVSYLDVSPDFRADLGFFQETNVRRTVASAFYTPLVSNDLVRTISIGAETTALTDRDTGTLLVGSFRALTSADLLDGSRFSVAIDDRDDEVVREFFIAGGRLGIQPGVYSGRVLTAEARSPLIKGFQGALTFRDGHFFGGTQRSLRSELSVYAGTTTTTALHELTFITPGTQTIVVLPEFDTGLLGHRLSLRSTIAFSPDVKLTFEVQANTLQPTATTVMYWSWRISGLSSLVAVATRSAPGVEAWLEQPYQRALLSFAYGLALP